MKIFAVAFNYNTYNKEGDTPLYNEGNPVVFLRADSSLTKGGRPVFLPDDIGEVHCATQLVVRICRLGKSIPERFAHRYYDAVTCGVTFTATTLLERLREEGLPWDMAMGFDGATKTGEWVALPTDGMASMRFRLDINGTTAMQGNTKDMVRTADQLIAHVSRHFTIRTGDLLFTGAPEPLCKVNVDDHITGYLEERKLLEFNVK